MSSVASAPPVPWCRPKVHHPGARARGEAQARLGGAAHVVPLGEGQAVAGVQIEPGQRREPLSERGQGAAVGGPLQPVAMRVHVAAEPSVVVETTSSGVAPAPGAASASPPLLWSAGSASPCCVPLPPPVRSAWRPSWPPPAPASVAPVPARPSPPPLLSGGLPLPSLPSLPTSWVRGPRRGSVLVSRGGQFCCRSTTLTLPFPAGRCGKYMECP